MLSLDGLDSLRSAFSITLGNTGIQNMQGLNSLVMVDALLTVSLNPNLKDLSGLDSVRHASVLLLENNPMLETLKGLSALTFTNSVSIYGNTMLTTLSDMSSLQSSNQIYISGNPSLVDLKAFENITDVWLGIVIQSNNALSSINLDALQSVGSIKISNNPSLASLTGLESLVIINEGFLIEKNPSLSSLSALHNLTSVVGNFTISYNDQLINLHGLESLLTIGGELVIDHNENLETLSGIDNLNSLSNLLITFNDNLSECDVESICNYLGEGGTNQIGANSNGCISSTEVLEQCTVSTNGVDSKNEIVIYPNPTSGLINWSLSGEVVSISITDAHGRKIKTYEDLTDHADITQLTQGVYILTIQKRDARYIIPVVKL